MRFSGRLCLGFAGGGGGFGFGFLGGYSKVRFRNLIPFGSPLLFSNILALF